MWRKKEIMNKKNEDDDIQEYVKPWVGLSPEDTFEIGERLGLSDIAWVDLMQAIEAKLKEKNT